MVLFRLTCHLFFLYLMKVVLIENALLAVLTIGCSPPDPSAALNHGWCIV